MWLLVLAKRIGNPVDHKTRPDLSANQLAALIGIVIIAINLILLWPRMPTPGSAIGQVCATIGAVMLLAPLAFTIMKRSGKSSSPPAWFVTHVLFSVFGACLIFVHVSAGDWLSLPGIILFFLIFLILQGSMLRAIVTQGFSLLFARSSAPMGFHVPENLDKNALQAVIDTKIERLHRLDPNADEALFSPALKHWLGHPWQSFRYLLLAEREARMIGARGSAARGLAWARRIHMLAATGFYLGLILHVVVVLFFAGYAADGGPIDWWYITAWGGP